MDSIEVATGTPDQALLRSEFSARLGAQRAMSGHANRTFLGAVDLLPGHSSRHGRTARSVVHSVAALSSVDDVTPHTLSHTGAALVLKGGSAAHSVQQFLGHAILAATPRSIDVSAERLCSAPQPAHPRA
ncbi:hypothetical protein [Cellulomonas sp. Leaf395]|uniref:hypothetical protein n=1 Tax=Cellulomonas sp. Leaf395 TaxID=1736362 RepID=UPI0006FAA568|nr:hypothetical protein [Cellulomonas sp. Leaf395]KQT00999.1 hypothetical protein ASG23_05115 [Cellulomonas sp. Leaf395]